MFGVRLRILFFSFEVLCASSSLELTKDQQDRFCRTVTHLPDSECVPISESDSVCTLPRFMYTSEEQFIDCSHSIIFVVINRYREIRENIHEGCNNTDILPVDYFEFLDQASNLFGDPADTTSCSPTGLLDIIHLVLDIPSFTAWGMSGSNADIWGGRAFPTLSPLSFPDITAFTESVSSLPPGKRPSVYSHWITLQTLYRYRPHAALSDDVFSIIDEFLDMSPERLLIKMYAMALKRSLRVSTRPIRPTDDEVLEHFHLLSIFIDYMDKLRGVNGNDLFNAIVPRDLLLFMIHQYSAGISIMKPLSSSATVRRFEVKNAQHAPITLANTPPGFFTSLVEEHANPYFVILGGSFDEVSEREFENLVLKFLDFSWSAVPVAPDPGDLEPLPGPNTRPNPDDVFTHAMLVMVYQMAIDAGVAGIEEVPYDRILNGTVSKNIYRKTLERLRIQKYNYLDLAAALVCRLDISHDAAMTFFKLLKNQNLETVEATTASLLHKQFSHRFIPIEAGYLDENPIAIHLPVPDEWGVNNLYLKFRATLGSRMNEDIYHDD